MKGQNKIPVFQRLILGLMQHLAAALVFVFAGGILFNSFIPVETVNGPKTYRLDPFSQKTSFEESEIFQDLFQTSAEDIIRLAVIRDQMEKEGIFEPEKVIDVTDFLNHYGEKDQTYGEVTQRYALEDLIKWGRYGIEYRNRVMSLSDFVNYYGQACAPENFALDSGGNLYFRGYQSGSTGGDSSDSKSEPDEELEEKMAQYSSSQLEDMAFSYIMRSVGDGVRINREDDGSLTVYINTLTCRYQTIDQKSHLFDCVDNWADFLQLQRNVSETVEILYENYELYQRCIGTYEEGNSNLKYVVRMRTTRGNMETYSNVTAFKKMDEDSLTEAFADYRGYLIYYPDSLEFMGNTELTEGEIYGYMRQARYPYPDEVYVWIAVDTSYKVSGDAFYYANAVFEQVVPYAALILTVMIILSLLWLGLGLYLTVTAGVIASENGAEYYLNPLDRIWTEAEALLVFACGYGAYRGYLILREITEQFYGNRPEQITGFGSYEIYLQFGSFAVYGFLVSMLLSLFWYSLIRRIKVGNLYRNSFVNSCVSGTSRLLGQILRHQNSVISVLLPYNVFLLVNLFAVIGIYNLQNPVGRNAILVAIVVLDAMIGVMLFKNNAEHNDIIDGIKRIQSGEVQYKLDVTSLHGTNRDLADAVNNIGDGIDNAVKTSMKDERLKTDLITNVSHDIKTPLTSIINYVDLLKRQDIRTEPAKSYIEILENKSQRLKDLTDDLVEASKITSGNIELNMEELNMGELLQQTIGEFSEKMEARNLQTVVEVDRTPALVYGDSRRMFRIMENLFNNICKYAMEGTRVYAQISVEEGEVSLFLKNVSQALMNIHADELTERFIRGDSARSTEGSGLGLFIAKSLTGAQGGTFEIQLDADLFKVKLTFPLYVKPEVLKEQEKKREAAEAGEPVKETVTEKKKKTEDNGQADVSEKSI